ncbi:sugar phosphate isomerase/epimerase [Acetobacteraceae bacterium KSS8]|uniref:Sugar phosphate isomerase/epimerase n=1 Tax=Endosaccharibacter trunci TaxID=2812733 RepID=A0ABT1WBW9_9PROT|nr:sugar phosphate isomerase/epimerase [Acetobacteraceae bacterium KSS8]
MKFGTLFSYWNTEWNCDAAGYARLIEKVAAIGFDLLEISADHVHRMSEEELVRLREHAAAHRIGFTINSGPAKEFDLASVEAATRQNGIAYFETILQKMVVLGADSLAGAIYSYWPADFVSTDKEGAWERSIAALKLVAKTAERLGITISLEVLNRNETYILTTSAEAVEYCRRIDSPSMKILLDTYHMNIEEDDLLEAIRTAGPLLGHFHVGENNRKLPGMNNSIDWKRVAEGLHEIGYDGNVVMEPFLLAGGAVGHSIRVWRDLSDGADTAGMDQHITRSLQFLRAEFAAR